MHKNRQHRNPLLTKTGKTRLGPLSLSKLQEMLLQAKPKHRSKIQNRINVLQRKLDRTDFNNDVQTSPV